MKSLLKVVDAEVCNILKKEFYRQKKGIELIASENFAPQSVLSVLGSVFTNANFVADLNTLYDHKFDEPRYYSGDSATDS